MVEEETHIQKRIENTVTHMHGYGIQRLRNTFARMMCIESPDALDLHLQLALMDLGTLITTPDQHTRQYYEESFTWLAEDVMEIRKRAIDGNFPGYFSESREVVDALRKLNQDPSWNKHRSEQIEDLSVNCQVSHSF